jgi:hypothetical protein
VIWAGDRIKDYGDSPNEELLTLLSQPFADYCAIERVRGFGIMASDGLFDTCEWTGRFLQAFGCHRTTLIPRKEVARHICGTGGVSHDKFIREALVTRFGGKDVAIGNRRSPGPLFGIAGHKWSALAVALTFWDQNDTGAAA